MATVTLTALANAAALDIGATDPGEALSSTQIANALQTANQMLGSWSIDQRFILSVLVSQSLTLTSGTQSYTIGSGGTWNITRPAAIIAANADITTAASTAYSATGDPQYAPAAAGSRMISPLKITTAEEWESWPMRDVAKVFPKALFYDRANNSGLGKVYVDLSLGGTVDIITWTVISQFADATTPLTVPDPAYLELMEYGLAVRMLIQFPGLAMPPTLPNLYSDAEARVKALNGQLVGQSGLQPAAVPQATQQATQAA